MGVTGNNAKRSSFKGTLVVAVLSLCLIAAAGVGLWSLLFPGEAEPETGSTTLISITEATDFRPATGTYSVPVYFGQDERGRLEKMIPDFFDGNSGVALYEGSVDAFVDFSGLTEDDITINKDDNSLTIQVPQPTLSKPNIDEGKSQVLSQNRGVLTRLGEFFDDQPLDMRDELDDVAVETLATAARESGLLESARDNTEAFLESLGKELGYDEVTVTFVSES